MIEPSFPVLILQMELIHIIDLSERLTRPLLRYLVPSDLATAFFFGGQVQPIHKTKLAVEKFIDRYGEAVSALNRAIVLSVAFVPIALLPSGDAVTIPLIDLDVTRRDWLRVCPAISYGLQIFTLVALAWFLLLRRGLTVLRNELGADGHFGEVANLMLTGMLGSLWLVIAIRKHFPSKWHRMWFVPVLFLLILVVFSPTLLCGYFVWELYRIGDLVPAVIYSLVLVPSLGLAFVLIGICALDSIHDLFPDLQGLTVHSSSPTVS